MHAVVPGKRFEIESRSSLFYMFRHYYGKGAHLGKSYRTRDS
ncbi:MAG: hypothetical protein WA747_03260 [Steroidobacteraceae bacterium]